MSGPLAYALFALGGGLGAALRHALGRLVVHRFPLATLLVNVLGSLVLGAVLGWSEAVADGGPGAAVERLVTGFTGGFTTFSSFALQSLALGRERSTGHLVANVALNLGSCLAALWLGVRLVGG